MVESGYKDFNLSTWWGVLAPAKTPKEIVDKLNHAVNDAAARDPVKARLANEGADPIKGSPTEFAQTLAQEMALWQRVAHSAGLTPSPK
jgi:tripartite-type tricarboxylate transporter receptor subunit TctC